MANGSLDPYLTGGDLGGQGMQDLYSTYTQYGYLMGGQTDFDYLGETWNLDPYDFTQENLLREKFREDYKDFTRSTGSIYSTAEQKRGEVAGQIGRAGFAGGGQSMKDFQSDVSTDIRDLKLGFQETKLGAIEGISGLREDYEDELFSTYMTYLDTQDPENMPDSSAIAQCYAQNQVYDHTAYNGDGGCVNVGELPEGWMETFGGYDPEEVPEAETGGPVAQCEAGGGSYDHMKGECNYPTEEWLAGDEVQCGEEGGIWNWGEDICEYPDTNEAGGYTFEQGGQTWDINCPPGWTQDIYEGSTGCCPPGGCTQGSGVWTEQGQLGSGVSAEDYATYGQFSDDFSYEEYFGGPTDAGYTDYYCSLHPMNPQCQ